MNIHKMILLTLISFGVFICLGCSSKNSNNDELNIMFCPGFSYISGSGAEKIIVASINRDNASGYLSFPNGEKINGGTLRPSASSNYRIAETRCFIDENASHGLYKLSYTIAAETPAPIEKNISWPNNAPHFSSSPRYDIISDTAFTTISVTSGKLINVPEGATVKYRIKIYEYQKGGRLIETSSEHSSPASINTGFRGGSNYFPVLEAIIVKDNSPIMVVHYVMDKLSS